MGRFVVVVGAQWGDEGKGKVVDLLTERVAGRRAIPGRAQRRPHAGHRRRQDGPVADSLGRAARGRALLHRQRRRGLARGAAVGGGHARRARRARLRAARGERAVPAGAALARDDRPRARACERGAQDRHHRPRRRPGLRGQDRAPRRARRRPARSAAFRVAPADLLDYHNFLLEKRLGEAPVDFRRTLDACLAQGERVRPLDRGRHGRAARPAHGAARTCCSRARRARCWTSTTARSRSSPRRTRSRATPPSAPASGRATSTTCSAS